MKRFLGILFGTLISISSWAADLYVSPTGNDANSGAATAPFRTILKASSVATPGSIIRVAPGIYSGGFMTRANGTSTSRIRYLSTTKWGAKIIPPASSASVIAWDNRGGYVDIEGFEVDGTNHQSGTRWLNGIVVRGENNAVKNNHVHHIGSDPSQCTGSGGSGIYADVYYGANRIDILNNLVHHIGIQSCYYIQGIYHTATGTIKNNLVYAVGAYGIHLWHNAHDIVIANNTVFGSGYGMVVGGGNFYNGYTAGAVRVKVSNNIIFDNTNIGIKESGTYGTDNTYFNNLVYRNGTNFSLGNGKSNINGLSIDPQFVNYVRTGGGDYHLKSTSPAIDRGSPTDAPAVDYDDQPRPQGAGFDIGAYEFVSNSTPPPSTAEFKIISGPIVSSLSETSAKISWSLSEPATGQVEYGTTSAYGKFSALQNSLYSSHEQVVSGLSSGTTYYFRVISRNAAGSQVISSSGTFKTLGSAPAPTVTVDALTYTPGSPITVQISGAGKTVDEYAALYVASNPDTAWSYQENWMFLNGTKTPASSPIASATLKFTAPSAPGTYNIRLFASGNMQNAGNRLAVSPTITVIATDNVAPSVAIISPASGTVPVGSYLTIMATASDNIEVNKVEFYINGNLICTDAAANYTCLFRASRWKKSIIQITAKAYDKAGNVSTSATVKVTTD